MKYVVFSLVWFAVSALFAWRLGKFLAATQESNFIDESKPFLVRSYDDDDL